MCVNQTQGKENLTFPWLCFLSFSGELPFGLPNQKSRERPKRGRPYKNEWTGT
jgi:hypothetical protein